MELRERGDSGTLLMRGKIGIRRQASCFSGMNDFNASFSFNITQIGFYIISGKSPPLQLLYYTIWISFWKVTKATYQHAVVVFFFVFFFVIAFRRSTNYHENSKSLRKRLMKIIMKKKTLLFLVSEVFSCLHILSCHLRNMKHERRDPTTFWELWDSFDIKALLW